MRLWRERVICTVSSRGRIAIHTTIYSSGICGCATWKRSGTGSDGLVRTGACPLGATGLILLSPDLPVAGDDEPHNVNHHRAILALSTAFWDAYLRNDAAALA
jgi:hypothetical protein